MNYLFPMFQRKRRVIFILVCIFVLLIVIFPRQRINDDVAIPKLPVPNVIHFVHFVNREDGKHHALLEQLDFVGATCILAAFFNQNPDKIVYHTNVQVNTTVSRYWRLVFDVLTSEKLEIRFTSRPTHVFGNRLTSVQHSSDVKRLQILLAEGGVTLDSDAFVVSKLDTFFHDDCTIGWPKHQSIGNQVIISRPGAKFIRLWLDSYRDYRPFMWYYNAGEVPTQHILRRNPSLVRRVETSFGVENLASKLYLEHWSGWKDYHVIHLLARHRSYLASDDIGESKIEVFDVENIQNYTKTFGDMARSVWNIPKVMEYLSSNAAESSKSRETDKV